MWVGNELQHTEAVEMGVVNELRTLFGTVDNQGDYQCRQCYSQFEVQYHVCPTCGSFRVESRLW